MNRRDIFDWLRIGLLSFGGPAAQIALMHELVVVKRKWMDEQQFLSTLSFCMLLPGPEAMQLATYSGWRTNGLFGGLIAGLLFVLPGAFFMMGLAILYATLGDLPLVSALFYGVKAAVLVVVVQALFKISGKALKSWFAIAMAFCAFLAIYAFQLPYPLVILGAGLAGVFSIASEYKQGALQPPVSVHLSGTALRLFCWLAIWLGPLGLLLWLSPGLLSQIAQFFSVLALVTFGGAYSVLAYMAQDVVDIHGWLTAQEMLDGLGLAETTPGPLILVTQFVAFLAAFKQGGILLGLAGATVALWMTFAPCFLWIFAGGPYIEQITSQPKLNSALKGITAAVVGVIFNLSLWFGLRVLFSEIQTFQMGPVSIDVPTFQSLDLTAAALFLGSLILAFGYKTNVFILLAVTALIGGGFRLFLG